MIDIRGRGERATCITITSSWGPLGHDYSMHGWNTSIKNQQDHIIHFLRARQQNEQEHEQDDDSSWYVFQRGGQVMVLEGVKEGNETEERREEAEKRGKKQRMRKKKKWKGERSRRRGKKKKWKRFQESKIQKNEAKKKEKNIINVSRKDKLIWWLKLKQR